MRTIERGKNHEKDQKTVLCCSLIRGHDPRDSFNGSVSQSGRVNPEPAVEEASEEQTAAEPTETGDTDSQTSETESVLQEEFAEQSEGSETSSAEQLEESESSEAAEESAETEESQPAEEESSKVEELEESKEPETPTDGSILVVVNDGLTVTSYVDDSSEDKTETFYLPAGAARRGIGVSGNVSVSYLNADGEAASEPVIWKGNITTYEFQSDTAKVIVSAGSARRMRRAPSASNWIKNNGHGWQYDNYGGKT